MRTILTYSLSDNSRSPFFADQTKMFSKKQWVTERFCTSDVLAHTLSTTVLGAVPARARRIRRRRAAAGARRRLRFTG